MSPVELTDGKGGGGVSGEPNHVTARKPGSLLSNHYSLPSPNSARVSLSRGLISASCSQMYALSDTAMLEYRACYHANAIVVSGSSLLVWIERI